MCWLNEESESGLPYDVVVSVTDEGPPHNVFVEVKTAAIIRGRAQIRLSGAEQQFAAQNSDTYWCVLVLYHEDRYFIRFQRELGRALKHRDVELWLRMRISSPDTDTDT